MIIECVVNVSEGRDQAVLGELAASAAPVLLNLHTDADHHRSVFTLVGAVDEVSGAARTLAAATVARLDLGAHQGAHPRLGVLDVVPFVPYRPGRTQSPPGSPLGSHDLSEVVPLRDEFARWLSTEFGIPSFLYGPLAGGQPRTLPQVRRQAFSEMSPDFGPEHPHRTAGASAVGARPVLVAYNLWVSSLTVAQRVAPRLRSPMVRVLGLAVGDRAQVSCNLVEPEQFGPAALFDLAKGLIEQEGGTVSGAELVGLIPQSVLSGISATRWSELGLSADKTVESRLPR
jgi:glutamate formiminotransferase / 5-formyltetrahydrofolate cyclo-ligase